MKKLILSVTFALLVLSAIPATAAPDIQVLPVAALNGTYGLQVQFDGVGGQAYVQTNAPSAERTIRVEMNINPNDLTMCGGINCKWLFTQGLGFRNGKLENSFFFLLRKFQNGLYKVQFWVKDNNSVNPGKWEQIEGFFLPSNGTTKVAAEWTAATDGNSDGEMKVYKNDELKDSISNIANEYDVTQLRLGHVGRAVQAGALGTMYVDDFVATRF